MRGLSFFGEVNLRFPKIKQINSLISLKRRECNDSQNVDNIDKRSFFFCQQNKSSTKTVELENPKYKFINN